MRPSGKNSVTKTMKAAEKIGWSTGIQMFVNSKTAARINAPRIGPQKVPAPPKMAMSMGMMTQLRLKAPPAWTWKE